MSSAGGRPRSFKGSDEDELPIPSEEFEELIGPVFAVARSEWDQEQSDGVKRESDITSTPAWAATGGELLAHNCTDLGSSRRVGDEAVGLDAFDKAVHETEALFDC